MSQDKQTRTNYLDKSNIKFLDSKFREYGCKSSNRFLNEILSAIAEDAISLSLIRERATLKTQPKLNGKIPCPKNPLKPSATTPSMRKN